MYVCTQDTSDFLILGQLWLCSPRKTDSVEMLEIAVLLSSTKPWNHERILTSRTIYLYTEMFHFGN